MYSTLNKTALYLRTSTDKQGTGLESQKRALIDYCSKNNITNYIIFEDFGYSGAKNSRPQLDLLMGNVALGKISTIIVYSFSRFARSTQHLLEASEIFKKNNVSFISITEQIDTSSPIGNAFFTIISAIVLRSTNPTPLLA